MSWSGTATSGVAALFAAALAPAQAQETARPAPASSPDDIVVHRMSRSEQSRIIGEYVNVLTDAFDADPMARYEPDIYCPAVFGLSDARNAEIAARMRRVAGAAGIKPAPPGCVASAFVFFVENKRDFLKTFEKQHPVFFYGLTGTPREEAGPAIAWLLTQDFDAQHVPLGRRMGGFRVVSSSQGGSRILSMMTRAVAASVVVVERKALPGLSTVQIADYAAMRSLVDRAPAHLDHSRRFTVLGVLDAPVGSDTPLSLTEWDLAYLKGRYEGDPRFYAQKQMSIIRGTMKQEINRRANVVAKSGD